MARRIGRRATRAGVVAWLLGAAPITTVALVLPGSTSHNGPTLAPPPDIPPQPGIAAPRCLPSMGQPDTWTPIVSVAGPSNFVAINMAGVPREQLAVAPTAPCRIYRADSSDTLTRSTDFGRSWQTVLHDQETGYQ